jgi:hypothetical protein
MVAAVLAARAVSYALYPNGDQRYTAVLFVVIPVALVIAVRLSTLPVSTSVPRRQTGEPPVSEISASELRPGPAISGAIAR